MSTLLKVDNIHVYYGAIHAIKGISFEVNEGEIVTLIGANGAGKSTTLCSSPVKVPSPSKARACWAFRRTSWCPAAWRCAPKAAASFSR